MASGATEGESRRKHRRSSSPSLDDAERSSKKHKHRHHRHRHHRHRGSSRKGEEEGAYGAHGGDSPPIPPALSPPAVAAPSSMPDDEVEEGEILEEEAIEPVEEVNSENLVNNSDTGVMLAKRSPTFAAENSEAAVDEFHSAIAPDSRINGDLIYELSRKDVRLAHQSHSKGRGKEKNHYDIDSTENGESDISDSRKSLSNSNADGYKMSPRSPCSDRYGDDRHRSHDFGRERSRSRSSLRDDGSPSRRRHPLERESSYYSEKRRIEYDSDDQKVTQHNRDSRHSGRGFVKDEEREWFTSHSRYDNVEYPHPSRERSSRDKNTGRDVDVEWKREERERKDRDTDRKRTERERSIGRELEWNRRRERERERERERSRERAMDKDRRREMEREKSIERGREGDRRREKERDKSRDRDRVSESKRDKDSERERERVREKSRERSWKSERFDERDSDVRRDVHIISKYKKFEDGYAYEDKHKYSKNSRGNESERNHDKIRKEDHSTVDASIIGGIKDDKVHRRDVDEQDDLDEPYALDLAEQEEEDLNRIKEESRRRREAIMEKYKNQKQQQQQQQQEQQQQQQQQQEPVQPNSEDAMEDKLYLEHHEKSSAEMLGNVAEGVDVYVAEPSFSVGKSAVRDGITATKRTFGERGLGEGTPKSEGSDAGFCDDIFGDSPAGARKTGKGGGLPMERSGLHDNWDDAEGYYSYRFGEILDGRYEVIAAHGKGVFSTVVRAKDLKAGFGEPEEVAIKILRNKEAMYKAGVEELGILKTLVGADPEDKRHCVRFLSSFKYRNHLCLVFESLNMNLREVLKKFGRNIGLKLTAVRAYAKQLFIALKHLRNCGVLHCDIKPDNMLVNEAKNVLKLCDFGNAMYVGKNEITPYLVSRFYRAPEIILGLSYGHPLDMWSVGCCLYELYTGKVLFPGPSNNDMLRLHMELKGPFPKKMLRKGAFMNQHFDSELNFLAEEEDSVTKKSIRRMIVNIKPKDIGSIIKGSPGEDLKMLANFKDLLDKVFVLDPDKRMTVQQALNHPFITGK